MIMNGNPFDDLIKNINESFKDLGEILEQNKEAIDKLQGTESLGEQLKSTATTTEKDQAYLQQMAQVCLTNTDALVATLVSRTKKNEVQTSDTAVFLSVLDNENKEKLLALLPDKERYETMVELDALPALHKQTMETILFNIQAEYFMRVDGENPEIDLFTDLFK